MYYDDVERIMDIIYEQIRTYDKVVNECVKLAMVTEETELRNRYLRIVRDELRRKEACNEILDRIKREVYDLRD